VNSPVPQKIVFNKFGQQIVVRVIAGKIMVSHEAIRSPDNAPGDYFFRYIPPNIPGIQQVEPEQDAFFDESSKLAPFDLVAREPKPPRLVRPELPDDDSPQHNLTPAEQMLIENAAAELTMNEGEVMDWFPGEPPEGDQE